MIYQNIPAELRQYHQWVCAGANKIPLNPATGQAASVTDPTTWGTFEEAIQHTPKYIGFVLTDNDPFTIIDLDNKPEKPATPDQLKRHQAILEAFNSYTERSASGFGFHIIVKGRVAAGLHRDNVEVYSSQRYMICTGNAVRQSPVQDYQSLLDRLSVEMKPDTRVLLDDSASDLTDREVYEMATRAKDGAKFDSLCAGDWESLGYPSQSEADLALMAILGFYTKDNEQVRRIFRMTKLGEREKATKNNRYVDYTLSLVRSHEPPPIDFEGLRQQAEAVAKKGNGATSHEAPPKAQEFPPGLIGEIAQYFLTTVHRPIPELAVASSIAFVSGVIGRSYNISGSGLNQYIVFIAKTGMGKEGGATAIGNLVQAIQPRVPMIERFLGPSVLASGQALIKTLDEKPCVLSILSECGYTLRDWSDPNALGSTMLLKKVVLDVWAKSGWNQMMYPMAYADKEKNTKSVRAPCFSIFGESIPERFFDSMDATHVAEGLIPRFTVIEYKGLRPPTNPSAGCLPSEDLTRKVVDIVTIGLATAANNQCYAVETDTDGKRVLDELDSSMDKHINGSGSEVESQLWNRVHLKVLRLSALLAVGINPHRPIITRPLVLWASNYIQSSVAMMLGRFKTGDVGQGDTKQLADLKRVINDFFADPKKVINTYDIDERYVKSNVIPMAYFYRRTANLGSFKNDKRGVSGALSAALKALIEHGVLQEIPAKTVLEKWNGRGKVFGLVDGTGLK